MDSIYLESSRWFSGRLMAYSGIEGETSYSSGIVVATSPVGIGFNFKLPAKGSVLFDLTHKSSSIGGDFFKINGLNSEGVKVEVAGVFIDTFHLLIHDPFMLSFFEQADADYAFIRKGDYLLIGTAAFFDESLIDADFAEYYQNYKAWFESLPLVETDNNQRNSTLARSACMMKTQIYTPEGHVKKRWSTPDRWPHRSMWLWDTAFHSIGWRHLDTAVAKEIFEAMLGLIRDDGFLPHIGNPRYISNITQPPVLAMAACMLSENDDSTGWLKEVYPLLADYVSWDLNNRDTDGDGLVEWFIEEDENCRSGESGMDNSTRFDTAIQLGAVDFNAFLCNESGKLSELSARIGNSDDSGKWKKEAGRIRDLICSKLYDSKEKFFFDYNAAQNELSGVLASSGFLPLLCDIPEDQIEGLCAHLNNPETFATPFPIPSIVSKDAEHSTDMWRGPTWICINWLVAEALDKHNRQELALALRRKTVEEIERWFYNYGTFFEYYDDQGACTPPRLMRKGKTPAEGDHDCHPHQAIKDFGWTATLYLDLVMRFSEKF